MRLTGHDALAGTIRPTIAGYRPPAGPARPSPKPPDEQALLHELWQISHFGWIPEAAIRRSLTIDATEWSSAPAFYPAAWLGCCRWLGGTRSRIV